MNDSGTEKAILEAALAEFAEKGIHGARTQTIANRAGVNKALLHYYYRSKEQLYLRALELITSAFWKNVVSPVKALRRGDLRGLTRIIVTFLVEEAQRAPYSRILIAELATGGQYLQQMDQLLSDSMNVIQDSILAFLQDGIDQGLIKPFHPMKIFNNIMGMCWNIFLTAPYADLIYDKTDTPKDAAFYQDYIELIIETIASGLETST
jgi:TetR/AcrR family transcriptional regulator